MIQAVNANAGMPVRILKVTSCPTTSGKSKITYHIGCSGGVSILFRVFANSRAGFFSKEWVPMTALEKALASSGDKPFTSLALMAALKGKSINTPAFLLAALKHEGLVKATDEKKRCYVKADSAPFWAAIKVLLKSDIDLAPKVRAEPKKAMPGGATTKAAVPSKGKSRSASKK